MYNEFNSINNRSINMLQVKVKRGESIDRALKRLKRAMDNEGIVQTLKDKRHFKKPSVLNREKRARSRKRAMFKDQDQKGGII